MTQHGKRGAGRPRTTNGPRRHTTSYQVPLPLREALDAAAERAGLTMAAAVREALDTYLARDHSGHLPPSTHTRDLVSLCVQLSPEQRAEMTDEARRRNGTQVAVLREALKAWVGWAETKEAEDEEADT